MGVSVTAHLWFGSEVPEHSELMEEILHSGEGSEYLYQRYADWKGIEIPTHSDGGWLDYRFITEELPFEVDFYGWGDDQIYVVKLKEPDVTAYCSQAKTVTLQDLTVVDAHAAEALKEFVEHLGLEVPRWLLTARSF